MEGSKHANRRAAERTQFGGRRIDQPMPGWFVTRLVRGGPDVPAVIWLGCPWVQPHDDIDPFLWCWPHDRSRRLHAAILDRPVNPDRVWTGRQIPRAEYEHLMELWAWAKVHAPHEPIANPDRPVDSRSLPAMF